MSRSRRKPYASDTMNGAKPAKQRANRTLRARHKSGDPRDEVGSGREYRKHVDTWSIRDYSWYDPKNPKLRRK
jgi:hypothetical protein